MKELQAVPESFVIPGRNKFDIKIERLREKQAKRSADAELIRSIINNPVVELAGVVAIAYLVNYLEARNGNILERLGASIDSSIIFTAGAGVIAAQQIAPAIPAIAQAGSDALKAIPGIAALAIK